MSPRLGRLTLVAAITVSLAACAAPTGSSWSYPPPATGGMASHEPGASHAPAAAAESIAIEAFDLGFKPAKVTVPAAGTYDVTFTNTGVAPHDVTFADGTTIAANGGETATGSVTVPDGGTTFLCSIPGHAAAGMEGEIAIDGGTGAGNAGGGDDHGGPLPAANAEPDPNAPAYEPYDATAPALLPGKVHDIDLVITEEEKTIATGFVQKVWTFGGTVPGPVIRVKVGDTIRVHLKNPAENQLAHSIDFHASQTAMNHQMVEIKPGATFTYTFTADYAGVWMYHCGTAPALHHIANGMFGMVIVEPKGGLPKVDEEVALVQSEWYLGAQGQPVDYAKANAAAPAPDFVVFNGVANQYKDNPIQVTTKGRVRVFVLDAGPNIDSSYHVVGTIFDTVTKEGIQLAKGNAGGWGSQAVDLSPAQGAIIEFSPREDGMYPMVTHAFNFVGKGAIGIFMAGDGDPSN